MRMCFLLFLRLVFCQSSPFNHRVGPVLQQIFQPLIDRHFVLFVEGDVQEGSKMLHHKSVTKWYMTGSQTLAPLFSPPFSGLQAHLSISTSIPSADSAYISIVSLHSRSSVIFLGSYLYVCTRALSILRVALKQVSIDTCTHVYSAEFTLRGEKCSW